MKINNLASQVRPFWLKLWPFAKERPPVEAAPPPEDETAKISRLVRRLSLAMDQQNDRLSAITRKLDGVEQSVLKQTIALQDRAPGVSLSESETLAILDSVDKLMALSPGSDLALSLLMGIRDRLLRATGWGLAAHVGDRADQPYHRVAEVQHHAHSEVGSVTQIIRQGYLKADGAVLRDAVVVVAGAPSGSTTLHQ